MCLAPFFATLSAVIPKIQSFFWDPEVHAKKNSNQLHTMTANGFNAFFMKKGSLIYICLINSQQVCPGAKDNPDDDMAKYFLDERHIAMQAKITNEKRPQPVKETSTYIMRQLEYLHMQFIALMTSSVINLLHMRPNLDIKSNIIGLEKTLDMMCEVTQKSPSCFLQAFQPLRLPLSARQVFNDAVNSVPKPSKLA